MFSINFKEGEIVNQTRDGIRGKEIRKTQGETPVKNKIQQKYTYLGLIIGDVALFVHGVVINAKGGDCWKKNFIDGKGND